MHMPTLPRHHATLMWTVKCVVVIATRLRTPTMGKRKPETPAQWTARLEWVRDQRTCASLLVSPCILGFNVHQFFSLVTSHKPFFTLSYISTCARCILDKTYAHIMHTASIDPTLSLSMPPTTQLRLTPSDDHHLSSRSKWVTPALTPNSLSYGVPWIEIQSSRPAAG